MGTPDAAVPTLTALAQLGDDVVVFTQPDRPRGRSGRPVPPPVKSAAEKLGLAVIQPNTRTDLSESTRERGPFDVGVVVAFGIILDSELLALPRHGFLNVHFSLLPRWRGAAPVERAILAGDANTGITIMQMDAGLDTGPILAARATAIGETETAGELTDRLSEAGAQFLVDILRRRVEGGLTPLPQNDEHATYAQKISMNEAHLDFTMPAVELTRMVRAFNPRPGAWASHDDRLKIWQATAAPGTGLAPGQLELDDERVTVGTGDGSLVLDTVQAAGKRPMAGADWGRGLRPGAPSVLR